MVVRPMAGDGDNPSRELHTIRDTVEGVWVAIVLAFVLRAFLIEAFVIPTGSMAPRLLGEHWALRCPADGYLYAYGAGGRPGQRSVSRRTRSIPTDARCPNCGYPYNLSREARYIRSGDRVLVLKYLYHYREPKPWDVVVFKNPQNNRENYIKRLIGLPGETIEIVHGDIFVKDREDDAFRIRRKPPKAQDATWQVIFDNDYQADEGRFPEADPPQWEPSAGLTPAGPHGRRFAFAGEGEAELEFLAPRERFLPWYGYNATQVVRGQGVDPKRDVCSDLKLSVMFVPRGSGARVGLELSSFAYAFRAEVDADGTAALMIRAPGRAWRQWRAPRSIRPLALNEGVEVALMHVDLGVRLRVGDETVFDVSDGDYPLDYAGLQQRMEDAESDPVPAPKVRITVAGAKSELWHVKLLRDVYYTCPTLASVPEGPVGDYARRMGVSSQDPGWGTRGNPITLRDRDDDDLDEFFVLGDNSPESLDGRSWTSAAPTLRLYDEEGKPIYKLGTVPRYCLTGRALLVYWPSGFRVPGLPGLPIIPNVGKMRLIR